MDTPFLHEVRNVKLVDIESPEVLDAALAKLLAQVREQLFVPRGSCLIFVVDQDASPEAMVSLRQALAHLATHAGVHPVLIHRPDLAVLEPSRAQLAEVLHRCGVERSTEVAEELMERYYCVPRWQLGD